MYGNERGVGQGITASGIAREQLFVTSKLGNGNHRPDDVRRSFDEALQQLGLDYLDLFLVHWPLPTLYGGDYVSTWKAMTALLGDGRLRSVGVSKFQPEHLETIISETGITPAVNQIEVIPVSTTLQRAPRPRAMGLRWKHGARLGRAGCWTTRP
jgi:2,5-diketo-D-gluconate reductase A